MLAQVNLFNLWEVLLTAIGAGVMTGSPTRRALVPALILFVAKTVFAFAGVTSLAG